MQEQLVLAILSRLKGMQTIQCKSLALQSLILLQQRKVSMEEILLIMILMSLHNIMEEVKDHSLMEEATRITMYGAKHQLGVIKKELLETGHHNHNRDRDNNQCRKHKLINNNSQNSIDRQHGQKECPTYQRIVLIKVQLILLRVES